MKKSLFFIICLAMLASACEKKVEGTIVAKVGNEYITAEEIQLRLNELGPAASGYLATKPGKKQFMNLLIREKLMKQAALKSDVAKSPEYKAKIEEKEIEARGLLEAYKDYTLNKMWVEEMRKKDFAVSDKEAREYYNKYPNIMTIGHILMKFDNKEAEALYRRLKSGGDFDSLAKQYSIDPETIYLPPIMRGEFLSELDDMITKMKVGEIQGIARTELGLHILKKFKQEKAKESEALPRIKNILQKQKFDKYIDDLQKQLKVEVLDEKYK